MKIAKQPFVAMLASDIGRDVGEGSAPAQRGKLFSLLLERLPIGLAPDSLLAGDFGPEFLPPKERDAVSARLAARKRGSAEPAGAAAEEEDVPTLMDRKFGIRGGVTIGHASADYARVVEHGAERIIEDIKRLGEHAGEEELDYRRAMVCCFEALMRWAEKYAALAEEHAEQATCASDRQRHRQIARVCRRVPRLPAE